MLFPPAVRLLEHRARRIDHSFHRRAVVESKPPTLLARGRRTQTMSSAGRNIMRRDLVRRDLLARVGRYSGGPAAGDLDDEPATPFVELDREQIDAVGECSPKVRQRSMESPRAQFRYEALAEGGLDGIAAHLGFSDRASD